MEQTTSQSGTWSETLHTYTTALSPQLPQLPTRLSQTSSIYQDNGTTMPIVVASTSVPRSVPLIDNDAETGLEITRVVMPTASIPAESNPSQDDFQSPITRSLSAVARLATHTVTRPPDRSLSNPVFTIESVSLSYPGSPAQVDEPVDEDSENDERNVTVCIICQNEITKMGSHRMVSLQCGHIYGRPCITKWLSGWGTRDRTPRNTCPTCKQHATVRHIRPVFADHVAVRDNSELEALREKYTALLTEHRRKESDYVQLQLSYGLLKNGMKQLEHTLDQLHQQNAHLQQTVDNWKFRGGLMDSPRGPRRLSHIGSSSSSGIIDLTDQSASWFSLQGSFLICPEKRSCRVLAYYPPLGELLVSVHANSVQDMAQLNSTEDCLTRPTSATADLPYGLLRLSLHDIRQREYVGLHHKPIRDIACCPRNTQRVLTTGLDKMAKIWSTQTNTIIQTYRLPAPGWACTWFPTSEYEFLVGLSSGEVLLFDTRVTGQPVAKLLTTQQCCTPIHSLVAVLGHCDGDPTQPCPLVIVGSTEVVLFRTFPNPSVTTPSKGTWSILKSPPGYACYSVSYDDATTQLLASYRNTLQHTILHHVYQLCQTVSSDVEGDEPDTGASSPTRSSPLPRLFTTQLTKEPDGSLPCATVPLVWDPVCTMEYHGTQTNLARSSIVTLPRHDISTVGSNDKSDTRLFQPTVIMVPNNVTAAVNVWLVTPSKPQPSARDHVSDVKDFFLDIKFCPLSGPSNPDLLVLLSSSQLCLYQYQSQSLTDTRVEF
ncbi:RING finger and WD repeat domain-containing protein 3 [Dispira simplex]|nr:RING finger and WD repeat domain-containing protein 3 [Dispira simplex]